MTGFPTPRLRRALWVYKALWVAGLPFALAYLWARGRKDADYTRNLGERFGRHRPLPGAVWVHAVSLGEVRSAVPLIHALLDRGERVVISHFTPAGRRESHRVFAPEIASGDVRAVWIPFEYRWCFSRFFKAFSPKFGLVMEIEIWPEMIMSARRARVALFMCNAQYPTNSIARDAAKTRWRADLMRGLSGAFVKSDLQRERFSKVGVHPITVTGELRFDQSIPRTLIDAGGRLRGALAGDRPVITIASAVEGEDPIYIDAVRGVLQRADDSGAPRPLFIYVPRAPERFDTVCAMIVAAGLGVTRRSRAFDAAFLPVATGRCDVFLGDSLGEMCAYLAAADQVVVGGGFLASGAHNIIETLALKKPVIVGPEIGTIEYPAREAIEAGVCHIVSPDELASALMSTGHRPTVAQIDAFFQAHSGATARTLAAIDATMGDQSRVR